MYLRLPKAFDVDNKLLFTSDLHLFNEATIKYTDRPFESVDDMNESLIKNWNKVVKKDDIIVVCGDLIFSGSVEKIKELKSKLNGIIYFVLGNHDYRSKLYRPVISNVFDGKVGDALHISIKGESANGVSVVYCTHCPIDGIISDYYFNVHGHLHTVGNRKVRNEIGYDVGVDNNNMTPISWGQMKTIKGLRIYNG